MEVKWCFGGAYPLHLQGRRVSQARNQHESGRKISACFMLVFASPLTLLLWNISWLSPNYTALYSRRWNWPRCKILWTDLYCRSRCTTIPKETYPSLQNRFLENLHGVGSKNLKPDFKVADIHSTDCRTLFCLCDSIVDIADTLVYISFLDHLNNKICDDIKNSSQEL
jgi:hypothetical protein